MNTFSIYDKVLLSAPEISQRKFCIYFNDAVRYLISRYGKKNVFIKNGALFADISTPDEDTDVFDEYADCIKEGIIAAALGDNSRRADFYGLADFAFKTVSRERAYNKAINIAKTNSGGRRNV